MTFEINGNIWELRQVNPNSKDLMRSDGTYTLGVCDNTIKTIYINQNLNERMFDKVLCHELVHAFCCEFDYYMDLHTEEIVADFVSLFGRNIVDLLDDVMRIILKRVA